MSNLSLYKNRCCNQRTLHLACARPSRPITQLQDVLPPLGLDPMLCLQIIGPLPFFLGFRRGFRSRDTRRLRGPGAAIARPGSQKIPPRHPGHHAPDPRGGLPRHHQHYRYRPADSRDRNPCRLPLLGISERTVTGSNLSIERAPHPYLDAAA